MQVADYRQFYDKLAEVVMKDNIKVDECLKNTPIHG